ncbi:MAG: hypothetical protein K2N90_03930 [Lachnospiraceae bacterium]|nr:hypothetical protein [Lachnospiraceae bacterium]
MEKYRIRKVYGKYDAGKNKRIKSLNYEMTDMKEAVRTGDASTMKLSLPSDVMNIKTNLQKNWRM